jgi:hypothetical protein
MRSVQDGKEALAKKGCQWSLGLSNNSGQECGMATIAAYIRSRHQTIAVYVAARPVFKACMEGKRRQGSMPRQWWWEQPMCLDAINATGSDASNGHLDAPAPTDK